MYLLVPLLSIIFSVAAEPSIDSKDLPRISPTEPDKVLSTFQVKPGFRLELAAAEPLVMDPIAMSFDENGRLFVVEMRDYSERRDERLGRIRMLEDTDGDGRFDKSSVYAKDLPWPTAVICYDGGAFVGSSPDILFLKDTDGDGAADVRELVFTGFGSAVERLNVQQLLNSFNWGLDNRIHGATGGNASVVTSPRNPGLKPVELRGRDFSFDPRALDLRPESGGAQYGLSFDDYGRKFVCSNSAHIQMVMYEDHLGGRNRFYVMPAPVVNIAEDGAAAPVYRISPDEPWRVIRTKWRVGGLVPGPIEGGGRPSGYFTSATGITIYRGNAWPKESRGDAFIADCGSNLIHRKQLFPDGVGLIARRPPDEMKKEFIASTDLWFRPVQFANAPDGTLYVADMYREVIEHPWSLPQPMKGLLDLNSGNDRGRIYRIVPDGFKQPPWPRLARASTEELVRALAHENGWHRDTAARLLHQRQDPSAVPALEKMAGQAASAFGRMHALHTLKGLNALSERQVLHGLSDPDPRVREHVVRLCHAVLIKPGAISDALWHKLVPLANDADPRVRYHLAFLLGDVNRTERSRVLSTIASRDCGDAWIGAAVLNSLRDDANYSFFLSMVLPAGQRPGLAARQDSDVAREFFNQLIRLIAAQKKTEDISLVVAYLRKLVNRNQAFLLTRSLLDGLRSSGAQLSDFDPQAQDRLKTIQREATEAVRDDNEPEGQRVIAIQLLGSMTWTDAGESLSALLASNQSQPIQAAGISALARFREPAAGQAMVRQWPQLTPRSRSEVLNALLSRPQQVRELLAGIEANLIQRSDLAPEQLAFLRTHRDAAIRRQAIKLLPFQLSTDREKIVQEFQAAIGLRGRTAPGHKIYLERCASCHRIGQDGSAVGPDLATVKSSGKEKLLASILDPNREVATNYLNYLVETNDGESLMGLITTESATSVTLRRAFGEESTILRSNIRRVQSMNLSIMPEGLEASLTPQDLADLLEFIVAEERHR